MIGNVRKAPKFETKNLIIREIELKDAIDFFVYACRDDVGPTAGWRPHRNISDTKAVISLFREKKYDGQLPTLAIILKENNQMIGTLELHSYEEGFKAELGYSINPEYANRGFATEASFKALEWGFDILGLERIECTMYVSNIASKKVSEKLHLTYEGIRKKGYRLYDGTFHDIYAYAITKEEYYSDDYREFIKEVSSKYGL